MKENDAELASNGLRALNEVELEAAAGGHAKIIKSVNMGYFGQINWFDNGCAQYITYGQGDGPCSQTMDVYQQC